jgi:dienelactone hydrolase
MAVPDLSTDRDYGGVMAFPDPPFVLGSPSDGVRHERRDRYDVYRTAGDDPRPAVVFVHGPWPAEAPPLRDGQIYQGYGRLTANAGLLAVVPALPFHSPTDAPTAEAALAEIVDEVRADPAVAADRVAIWAFSGGGWLIGRWLSGSPDWLRCLALTYPALRDDPVVAGRPIVLTRVGLERQELQAAVDDFLARAKDVSADVQVIDVPDGHHGFDALDHTDQSRDAVRAAMVAVTEKLMSKF